jgi:sugar lactone lactonase YvrE
MNDFILKSRFRILVILFLSGISVFTLSQSYNNPESVVFDYDNSRWLISNMGDGNILQLDLDGNLGYFVESGLDNPKGITIVEGVAYVNENTSVKGFDLTTGNEVFSLAIAEAAFLNDIEPDKDGHLFLSGSDSDKIYKVYLSNGTYTVFANVSFTPNGLLLDPANDRLLLCYFSTNSPIDAISLSDSSFSTAAFTSLSNLDGLAVNASGDIFVSSWGTNAIYRFDPEFLNPPEMVADGFSGPADIFIDPNSDILAIPEYNGNTITFKTAGFGGNLLNIPGDFPTIQAGIDSAEDGDIILVANGTYAENLNFKGKNINLSSRYVFNNSIQDIDNTIIDGSNPVHPDTASCVLFINGETRNAIIQGFTITGGTGTKWEDEHGAGLFTEGGAILIQYSSPTILSNKIMYNAATNTTGTVSAGGGAIRCGDSNPLIQNNLIAFNQGRYGGGIVLNFSAANIRNNIIDNNSGGEDFGGSGIWMYSNGDDPSVIYNNTITNNHSASTGGGMRIWSSSAEIVNSIIWGNTANSLPQIHGNGGVLSYCNVQGGWSGEQNIDADPLFEGSTFYLTEDSPCVDAGNPGAEWNDPEDPFNPGEAAFPSMGNLQNDMGAFGGPYAKLLSDYVVGIKENPSNHSIGFDYSISPNPVGEHIHLCFESPVEQTRLRISNLCGACLVTVEIPNNSTSLAVDTEFLNPGFYIVCIESKKYRVSKKMIKR